MVGSLLQFSSLHSLMKLLVFVLCLQQNVLVEEVMAVDVARQILQTLPLELVRMSTLSSVDCR